jgi:hypothetical protein
MKPFDDHMKDLRVAFLNEQACACQEPYCQHVMDLVDAVQKVVSAWEREQDRVALNAPVRTRIGGGL